MLGDVPDFCERDREQGGGQGDVKGITASALSSSLCGSRTWAPHTCLVSYGEVKQKHKSGDWKVNQYDG